MIKVDDKTLLICLVLMIFMISYLSYDPDKENKVIRYDCKLADTPNFPKDVKDHCVRLFDNLKLGNSNEYRR